MTAGVPVTVLEIARLRFERAEAYRLPPGHPAEAAPGRPRWVATPPA